jgi:hypothetical protein
MVDTKMTKTVGEHWVCATLARYGWAPALTRDGLARTDILAVGTLLPHRPTVEIQVKTASDRGRNPSWPLGDITRQAAESEHEWFVLVLLPELPLPPRAFVVPRDHVCAGTWIAHEDWLTDPSAPEGTRNADLTRARISLDVWQGYKDCWDLLGTRTSEVKVRLPAEFRELAQENGLACLRVTRGTRHFPNGDTGSALAGQPLPYQNSRSQLAGGTRGLRRGRR